MTSVSTTPPFFYSQRRSPGDALRGAFFIFALYLQGPSQFSASREQDLPHHIFPQFGHIFHGISLFSPIDQG